MPKLVDLPELAADPSDDDWFLIEDVVGNATKKARAWRANPLSLRTADERLGAQFRRQDSLGGPQIPFATMWRSGMLALGTYAVALGDLGFPGLIVGNGAGVATLLADNVTPVILFGVDGSNVAQLGDTSLPIHLKGASVHIDTLHNNDCFVADDTNGCGIGIAGKPTTYTGGAKIMRTATATNYTATVGDYLIAVTDTTAARTITLPSGLPAGTVFIIKDESGGAAVHNITATPASGTIDGAASAVIATAYGSLAVYTDGTNWFTA